MAGDATLFMRRDAVESAWRFVMPILDALGAQPRARHPRIPVRHLGTDRSRPHHRGGRPAMEDAMTAKRPHRGPGMTPVPLRDVERDAGPADEGAARAGGGAGAAGRMANLVIFCNSLEQAVRINAQIPEIEAVHPARVLLLVGESGHEEREVTARVTGAAVERRRRAGARPGGTGDAARGRRRRGSAAVRGAGAC